MSTLGAWIVGGLYLDGWAHGHGKVDDTFFTPWHGVLYGGLFAFAAALVIVLGFNYRRGYALRHALPTGYALSLTGVPLFLVAGAADLVWHTLFGFEVGIEPLVSPPHLVLASATVLMIGGPLRAALTRTVWQHRLTWPEALPILLAVTGVWSIFTFFTEFAHPFSGPWAARNVYGDVGQSLGAAAILLQTALTMGLTLVLVRRWQLPFGSFVLMYGLNAALMSVLNDQYRVIGVALAVGLIVDVLCWYLPLEEQPAAVRVFAFTVPVVLQGAYFIALFLTGPVSWSTHLWLGTTMMSGVCGWLLSYVAILPAVEN